MHESSPAHGPPSGKPSGQRHLRHQTRRGTDSMNRIYRKIWSVERGVVVASELAKAKGKGKGARLLQAVLVAGVMASAPAIAGDVCEQDGDGATPPSATQPDSLACGNGAVASGEGSTAIGSGSAASEVGASAFGEGADASGAYAGSEEHTSELQSLMRI